MRRFNLACAAALCSFLGLGVSAQAASPITNALVANVQQNLDFLARSSALAGDRSSGALQSFARAEVEDANATRMALAETLGGSSTAVASNDDSTALMTGRSVAIDGPTAGPGQAANGRAPLGTKDCDALAKLSGKSFNDAFWFKQLDALSQLRADYQAYIDDGDDAKLVALAKRELPRVEARLADLAKL